MRTNFRLYGGVRVCHLDFTNLTDEAEALVAIEDAKRVIAAEPPHSIYTLTDVTGSQVTPRLRSALQELTAHNKPFVIAGAIVGTTAIQRVILRTIVMVTGRRLEPAESTEAAIAWISEQMKSAKSARPERPTTPR